MRGGEARGERREEGRGGEGRGERREERREEEASEKNKIGHTNIGVSLSGLHISNYTVYTGS